MKELIQTSPFLSCFVVGSPLIEGVKLRMTVSEDIKPCMRMEGIDVCPDYSPKNQGSPFFQTYKNQKNVVD